jgi:hypothetical protein
MRKQLFVVAFAVVLTACASDPQNTAPSTPAEHAHRQPATSLVPDEFDAPAASSVAEAAKASGDSHAADEAHEAALYVCPMHPEVTSATPGKCPKCGMTLVRKARP